MGRGTNMDDPQGFSVRVDTFGTDVIVRAVGELDLASAPQLHAALERAEAAPSGRVILDLRELSFSDAAGLRVIETASKQLGQRLIVFGSPPPVRHLFEVAQLDQLILREGARAPASDVPASNLAYVRRLWEGFRGGGLARIREMLPADAEWRPLDHVGRALRGVAGLAEFWSAAGCAAHVPTRFAAVGDDVLVSALQDDGEEVWLLFRFDDRRLLGAACYRHEADAIAAHRIRRAS